jgi:hypothetical protein
MVSNIGFPALLGEIPLMLWLLIKGAKPQPLEPQPHRRRLVRLHYWCLTTSVLGVTLTARRVPHELLSCAEESAMGCICSRDVTIALTTARNVRSLGESSANKKLRMRFR